MSHQLQTEVEINAPSDVVWDVLTDLDHYPEWNPYIVESTGSAVVGERLTNRLQPPGGKARTFRPTVTEVEPERSFEWLGHLGLPGIFDGRHRFELQQTPSNGTTVVHSEKLTGVLVPLMRSSLDTGVVAGFAAMDDALKERSERRAGADS